MVVEPVAEATLKKEVDLQQFCSTESLRPYLHKPFSRGEHTYATDGHVAIRVARQADAPEQEKPAVEKVFADHFKDGPRAALQVELPKLEAAKEECRECEGSGLEHECPDCTCECDNCDGTGEVEKTAPVVVDVNGAIFNAYYIAQLLELPNLQFATNPDKKNAATFTFDGGDGLLMPMRYASVESKIIKATSSSSADAKHQAAPKNTGDQS